VPETKFKMSFCSICLDGYEEDVNKEVVVINCSHVFHRECIVEWYEINRIPIQYNEKDLPDILQCPVCKVSHRNAEFRRIFLTVDNFEHLRLLVKTRNQEVDHLANSKSDIEVIDVESEAETRELKEKVVRLQTTVKELERTVESKDVALNFLRGQKHQSSRKRARMSSRPRSPPNCGNNSELEEFQRSGKSNYHLRTRKSR